MQPHYSHVRRPVSTCAFRAHNTKKHYKSTQCVAEKGVHENPSQAPVVPLAPYLHSFCRSCVSETENSFERGLLHSRSPPRHARHVMGAARRGRALDTAGAALHTPATPGHTIGLLRRPEVTSTFSVGKANPSEPGIENRRNLDSTGRRPLENDRGDRSCHRWPRRAVRVLEVSTSIVVVIGVNESAEREFLEKPIWFDEGSSDGACSESCVSCLALRAPVSLLHWCA